MNERGFTLAELLVASAVLGIIMLGVLLVQRQGLTAYLVGAGRVEVQQNARAALQIAGHGYVLETGSVAIAGPSEAISRDARVAATYLGRPPNGDVAP